MTFHHHVRHPYKCIIKHAFITIAERMNAHKAILKAVRVRSSFACSKQIMPSAYAFTYAIFHQIHTFNCCITTSSHFILKRLNLISFLDMTHDNSLHDANGGFDRWDLLHFVVRASTSFTLSFISRVHP
eukprot:134533_1